jgi:hypothetical protein
MSSRRSSRLATKNRVDYNEENRSFMDMDIDQVNVSSNKGIVQIVENVQTQPFMKNDSNSLVIDTDEIQNDSSNSELQYTSSNYKEKCHGITKVKGEKPPEKFERITKVNKNIFRQASKTLSELKFAIESTKSAVYSFESCLKGNNKSLFDDNASTINNHDHNEMDIDETYVINDVNDNSSGIGYKNDSHNVHNIDNSLKITEDERIEDSELVINIKSDQENQPKNYSERVQDIGLQKQDLMEVDYQQPIPQFTLMLSDDLKEAFKPDLPISTSLEDTDIIVYDPADPDFNNDDLIVTLVERKQNMTTRKKIRLSLILLRK